MTRPATSGEGGLPGPSVPPSLATLTAVFVKISLLGFGGPNAHLALMLDEVVERRGWVTRKHFLQLMGITNLLPGPNSSEVAIHLGYTQRGWRGALATGLGFLLPTFVLILLFSWLYFRFGTLPEVESVLWGLKPVVLGIILWAGWKLARTAVTSSLLFALALGGGVVSLVAGRWAVAAMVFGGWVTWWLHRRGKAPASRDSSSSEDSPGGEGSSGPEGPEHRRAFLPLPLPLASLALPAVGQLGAVFLLHLAIGSVLFGGGYVLVALLEPYAVGRFGWLTGAQFLDGVALSQAVPGPISTLSAFVGYAAAGVPGAVLGTAGIYLPAFAVVLFVAPHLDRVRHLDPVRAALDGVSAVVGGAVLGVGASLAPPVVEDPWAAGLFLMTLAGLAFMRIPAPWLIPLGLVAGGIRTLLV